MDFDWANLEHESSSSSAVPWLFCLNASYHYHVAWSIFDQALTSQLTAWGYVRYDFTIFLRIHDSLDYVEFSRSWGWKAGPDLNVLTTMLHCWETVLLVVCEQTVQFWTHLSAEWTSRKLQVSPGALWQSSFSVLSICRWSASWRTDGAQIFLRWNYYYFPQTNVLSLPSFWRPLRFLFLSAWLTCMDSLW